LRVVPSARNLLQLTQKLGHLVNCGANSSLHHGKKELETHFGVLHVFRLGEASGFALLLQLLQAEFSPVQAQLLQLFIGFFHSQQRLKYVDGPLNYRGK
jgi:hypothetical protein